MKNMIFFMIVSFLALPVQAQEPLRQSSADVVSYLDSGRDSRDVVADKLIAIDGYVGNLLLSIANEFDVTYNNPPRTDAPLEVLRKNTNCNASCTVPDMIRRGYQAQQALVSKLESHTEELRRRLSGSRAGVPDLDKNVLVADGEELLLLTFSLKANAIARAGGLSERELQEIGTSGEDGNPPPPDAIVFLAGVGAAATYLSFCSTLGSAADCIDSFADNATGIGDRRRQAADAGIRHPNASWGCAVWNVGCDHDY